MDENKVINEMYSREIAMEHQISIFDDAVKVKENNKTQILSVGDRIGRVVLGECRIATITVVEGLPLYPFYRTDTQGCYDYEEGLCNIDELVRQAERNRAAYKTIIPRELEKRITVEYLPRKCDGVVLWAQIGIYDNMLFWKNDVTYQFLEILENEKKLKQEYEKRKSQIMDDVEKGRCNLVEQERALRRLYLSNHGFYADAEYVYHNG